MHAALAFAQASDGQAIGRVTFVGLERINPAYVRDIVGIRDGDTVTTQTLEGAKSRLLRTGRFLSVDYAISGDDAELIFTLAERRLIRAIRFEGHTRFSSDRLRESVGLQVDDNLDWFAIRGGAESIRLLYQESGYSEAVVSFDRELLEQTGELVYRVEEGVRVRIKKIRFEGNERFDERELKLQIVSREAFGLLFPGDFDEDRAAADATSIQAFYRDLGYLDARAGFRREISDNGEDLTLTFTISEGVLYRVEDITIEGNEVILTEELLETISTRVDEPVRRPFLDEDVKTIRNKYWELGYIYVNVRSERVFSDQPEFARIRFTIDEGRQYKVGRVLVRGNTRTRDKVIRRALNLYPPDDLFDLNQAKEAENKLRQTQIFESATVYPIGDDPERRDVVMDVRETERNGDLIFGLGVTSNSGLVGTLNVDFKNFDLSDTPRSWSELWKMRAFFGGGQRLRLELQPGTEVNRFRIDFTEPFFMDQPLRFDMSAYLFDRRRDGYNEGRLGLTTAIGKRFEKGPLFGWSGELAVRFENAQVDDIDLFTSNEVREDEGSNYLSSLKATLVRDRTDSFFLPSEGDRLRLSYEQFGLLGGAFDFGRFYASYTWYKTLRRDKLDRKSVLRLNAEGGFLVGDAPVIERFFAGGTGSMRGFNFRGIGERDGLDDTNVGGDYLLLLGAEYAFPLFGENVRGHVFLDTGTAGRGGYRAAAGVGVRIVVELLGPLPLEFNIALPISSEELDDEQVFSFLVGTLF
ncbi:MAG: outer membrane protein assembly factor BamA [Phycisphaerae bacterium]